MIKAYGFYGLYGLNNYLITRDSKGQIINPYNP